MTPLMTPVGRIACRVRRIRIRDDRRSISLTHVLILLLYLFSICFVFSAAILESILDTETHSVCQSSIIVCLAFYASCKTIMRVDWSHQP
jgi:hypothetical protein